MITNLNVYKIVESNLVDIEIELNSDGQMIAKDKDHLKKLIELVILNSSLYYKADLNCIDTSLITDMSGLFNNNIPSNGWNLSKVTTMKSMFSNNYSITDIDTSHWGGVNNYKSNNDKNIITKANFNITKFNGDISKWNVSNVKDMSYMFSNSSFNGDISKWNVGHDVNMTDMFKDSPLEGNEPHWYKK